MGVMLLRVRTLVTLMIMSRMSQPRPYPAKDSKVVRRLDKLFYLYLPKFGINTDITQDLREVLGRFYEGNSDIIEERHNDETNQKNDIVGSKLDKIQYKKKIGHSFDNEIDDIGSYSFEDTGEKYDEEGWSIGEGKYFGEELKGLAHQSEVKYKKNGKITRFYIISDDSSGDIRNNLLNQKSDTHKKKSFGHVDITKEMIEKEANMYLTGRKKFFHKSGNENPTKFEDNNSEGETILGSLCMWGQWGNFAPCEKIVIDMCKRLRVREPKNPDKCKSYNIDAIDCHCDRSEFQKGERYKNVEGHLQVHSRKTERYILDVEEDKKSGDGGNANEQEIYEQKANRLYTSLEDNFNARASSTEEEMMQPTSLEDNFNVGGSSTEEEMMELLMDKGQNGRAYSSEKTESSDEHESTKSTETFENIEKYLSDENLIEGAEGGENFEYPDEKGNSENTVSQEDTNIENNLDDRFLIDGPDNGASIEKTRNQEVLDNTETIGGNRNTIIVNNYSTEETDNQEILDNFETTEGNQIKYKENNYGDENSKVDVENKEVQDTSVILGSQEDNNLEDNTNIRTSLEETVHPEEQYNTVNTEEQENTNIEDNSVGEKSIIEAENKEQQDNAVTAGSQEENVSVQASQEQQGENGEEGTTKIEENVSTKMLIEDKENVEDQFKNKSPELIEDTNKEENNKVDSSIIDTENTENQENFENKGDPDIDEKTDNIDNEDGNGIRQQKQIVLEGGSDTYIQNNEDKDNKSELDNTNIVRNDEETNIDNEDAETSIAESENLDEQDNKKNTGVEEDKYREDHEDIGFSKNDNEQENTATTGAQDINKESKEDASTLVKDNENIKDQYNTENIVREDQSIEGTTDKENLFEQENRENGRVEETKIKTNDIDSESSTKLRESVSKWENTKNSKELEETNLKVNTDEGEQLEETGSVNEQNDVQNTLVGEETNRENTEKQ